MALPAGSLAEGLAAALTGCLQAAGDDAEAVSAYLAKAARAAYAVLLSPEVASWADAVHFTDSSLP